MPKRFLIKLAEFNRIYQCVHGTIANETRAEKSCVFFAIAGSFLLNKYLKIGARPVAGGFVLRPTAEDSVIGYAKNVDGAWGWGDDAFHMWVETETHILDFMSPIYREAFAEGNPDVVIPRKMFQMKKTQEAQSPNELPNQGDFFTFPDPDMSEELTEHFLNSPTNTDLLEIVDHWFCSNRRKQSDSFRMMSNDGVVHALTLPQSVAIGSW